MKIFRSLFAAMAMVLAFASCGKETEEENSLVGTWKTNRESSHWFLVSFDDKGGFDWQVLGVSEMRETGSYTSSDSEIVLKTKKYYDRWDDATGTEYADRWIEKPGKPSAGYPDDFKGVRTLTIHLLKDGFLHCAIKGDNMFGDMLEHAFLFKDGSDQKLNADIIKGTWVAKDSRGTELGRYVFNGSNYSRVVRSDNGNHNVIWDDSGTWTYSKGIISFRKGEYETDNRVFLDGDSFYIAHSMDWGFSSSGYEYKKQ